jgi:hypothetical protein
MSACDDCAFRLGTSANGHKWTLLKARLCLITGEAFYCHRRGEPQPVCAGYDEARRNQPDHPQWRVDVAARLSQIQELAESSPAAAKAITDNFSELMKELC